MTNQKSNTRRRNYRRLSNKVKKLDLNNATNAQLEELFNKQHIKYVMSLEDQLQEDKAHLLLKQNTIETLEEDLRVKNNLIRRWVIHGHKSAKRVEERFKEYKEAYNGLSQMGHFAEELGVDIKKHNGKLPENSKWDFEHKHTLTESGKVKHQYKLKPKK